MLLYFVLPLFRAGLTPLSLRNHPLWTSLSKGAAESPTGLSPTAANRRSSHKRLKPSDSPVAAQSLSAADAKGSTSPPRAESAMLSQGDAETNEGEATNGADSNSSAGRCYGVATGALDVLQNQPEKAEVGERADRGIASCQEMLGVLQEGEARTQCHEAWFDYGYNLALFSQAGVHLPAGEHSLRDELNLLRTTSSGLFSDLRSEASWWRWGSQSVESGAHTANGLTTHRKREGPVVLLPATEVGEEKSIQGESREPLAAEVPASTEPRSTATAVPADREEESNSTERESAKEGALDRQDSKEVKQREGRVKGRSRTRHCRGGSTPQALAAEPGDSGLRSRSRSLAAPQTSEEEMENVRKSWVVPPEVSEGSSKEGAGAHPLVDTGRALVEEQLSMLKLARRELAEVQQLYTNALQTLQPLLSQKRRRIPKPKASGRKSRNAVRLVVPEDPQASSRERAKKPREGETAKTAGGACSRVPQSTTNVIVRVGERGTVVEPRTSAPPPPPARPSATAEPSEGMERSQRISCNAARTTCVVDPREEGNDSTVFHDGSFSVPPPVQADGRQSLYWQAPSGVPVYVPSYTITEQRRRVVAVPSSSSPIPQIQALQFGAPVPSYVGHQQPDSSATENFFVHQGYPNVAHPATPPPRASHPFLFSRVASCPTRSVRPFYVSPASPSQVLSHSNACPPSFRPQEFHYVTPPTASNSQGSQQQPTWQASYASTGSLEQMPYRQQPKLRSGSPRPLPPPPSPPPLGAGRARTHRTLGYHDPNVLASYDDPTPVAGSSSCLRDGSTLQFSTQRSMASSPNRREGSPHRDPTPVYAQRAARSRPASPQVTRYVSRPASLVPLSPVLRHSSCRRLPARSLRMTPPQDNDPGVTPPPPVYLFNANQPRQPSPLLRNSTAPFRLVAAYPPPRARHPALETGYWQGSMSPTTSSGACSFTGCSVQVHTQSHIE